jgi:hypothetical protein
MISPKVSFVFVALCSGVAAAYAQGPCDKVQQGYLDCVRLVDSLRPEKAGQMRVFAADGSEFNAGQVQWMKGQLRKFDRLCARGDAAEAANVLAGVQELLESHRRRS